MQRFELIDPLDRRVVQPADVAAGRAPPADLYRVKEGSAAGRVAAGRPRIDSRPPTPAAPRGTRAAAGRRLAVSPPSPSPSPPPPPPASILPPSPAAPRRRCASRRRRPTASCTVEADALAALRAAPAPVCVLAVAGPAREGKSTLSNAVASALGGGGGGALPGRAWL